MTERVRTFSFGSVALVALVVASTVAVTLLIRDSRRAVPTFQSAPLVVFPEGPTNPADIRNRDITFYGARVESDQASAIDRATLAGLLFARARVNGSVADLTRAESLARASMALRSQRNFQVLELLASILMAQHRFSEAHTVASRANTLDPGTPSHLALLGEIELELGQYELAATHFTAVHVDGEQFTIGARLARWYEVTGRTEIARQFLRRAILSVGRRDDLPREQVAWFHYRLGELELRVGNINAADSALQGGLRQNPNDVRVLGALSRVAFARGAWAEAVDYGERATAVQLDPTTLGVMSRAYAALADSAQSASFANAMSVSALEQPGVIHRAWGQFLLDFGNANERAGVLTRARRELRERKDVYGHDLVAWALYRSGRVAEAKKEMALALAQCTEDVMLADHARVMDVRRSGCDNR